MLGPIGGPVPLYPPPYPRVVVNERDCPDFQLQIRIHSKTVLPYEYDEDYYCIDENIDFLNLL